MAYAARPAWRSPQVDLATFAGGAALALLGVISGLLIGRFGAPGGLFPGAVLALALTRYWVEAAPIAALLSAFVTTRVPGLAQASGISISDVLVSLATGLVLTQISFTRPLRRLLTVVAIYQLALLAPVVMSGTRTSYVEWLHRAELVGGAMLCGALIAQRGRALLALRLVAALAGFYAVVAIAAYARTREAAYVLTLQKNGLGTLLMMVLLVVLYGPALLPPRWRWAFGGLLIGGIFASQSRGAMVGAVAGVLVASLMGRRRGRLLRVVPVLLLAAGSLVYVYVDVQNRQANETEAEVEFSSTGTRAAYRDQSIAIWKGSPLTGAGLKIFNDPAQSLKGDPHNYVVLALAEGGLFGLFGVFWLQLGALETVRRHRSALTIAAVAVVIARATHGLFDVYWLGGTGSFCWIVVGMAVGSPWVPQPATLGTRQSLSRSVQPATAGLEKGTRC